MITFTSDDARALFENTPRTQQQALSEIGDCLKKPVKIYTGTTERIHDINETKAVLAREGPVLKLYIGWNEIDNFPGSIMRLPCLQELHVQVNHFSCLPDTWHELPQLHVLNLSFNELESIPPSLGKLDNLWEVNLGFNQLSEIPGQIIHWRDADVMLVNNPIESFSWSILESTCTCYFTQDEPKMGIGYSGDISFTGLSRKIWEKNLKKYTGYRDHAEELWDGVKEDLRRLKDGTRERIEKTIKEGHFLDPLDFTHPDFEQWIPAIEKSCQQSTRPSAKEILKWLEKY